MKPASWILVIVLALVLGAALPVLVLIEKYSQADLGYVITIIKDERKNVTSVELREGDFSQYNILSRLFAELRNGTLSYGDFPLREEEVAEAERMFDDLTARNPAASLDKGKLFVKWEGQIYRMSFGKGISN